MLGRPSRTVKGQLYEPLWGVLFLRLRSSGGTLGWYVTRPVTLPETVSERLTGDAQAGERIFLAAGCASCHMGTEDDADPLVLERRARSFENPFRHVLRAQYQPRSGPWNRRLDAG